MASSFLDPPARCVLALAQSSRCLGFGSRSQHRLAGSNGGACTRSKGAACAERRWHGLRGSSRRRRELAASPPRSRRWACASSTATPASGISASRQRGCTRRRRARARSRRRRRTRSGAGHATALPARRSRTARQWRTIRQLFDYALFYLVFALQCNIYDINFEIPC